MVHLAALPGSPRFDGAFDAVIERALSDGVKRFEPGLLARVARHLEAGSVSGLVESLFLAGGLSFLLPVGRLADATDKRLLYKLGLLTFGITSILIGRIAGHAAATGALDDTRLEAIVTDVTRGRAPEIEAAAIAEAVRATAPPQKETA